MSAPMLTPRDRGMRWRAIRYATSVAYYLQGMGLTDVRLRTEVEKPLKLSEAILEENPDLDTGTLTGLKRWSISTHSDARHDWSGNLRQAQQAKGRKEFVAVCQYRKHPAAAADQFVLMSLVDFARVVAITEGVEQ